MDSLVFSICVFLIYACLILFGCKKRSTNIISKKSCLQNLNDLRGLFALEIVLGHVVRWETTILLPFGKFMICSVAFFFFVSAFGMAISYEEKEKYLSYNFLISKPLYLFIITVIFFLVNMTVDSLCPNDLGYFDLRNILQAFFVSTNWYIWELIGFYIIFFVVYKYMDRFRVLIISGITIVLSVVMYQIGLKEAYVASTFAFPLGLLFGEYFEQVKKFLFSFKGVLTTAILSLFGVCCLFFKNENLLSMVFMRNALCVAAIVIIFYGCTHFTLGENPIAKVLCRYSTEIYLSQFIWLRLTESYGWNYMIRMPLVVAATVIMAVALHPIVGMVRKYCCCK